MKAAQAALLDRLWPNRAADLPFTTREQAIILASIVEKETALPSERRHIASVFVNRLRIGMPLQSDPTIIYGMGASYRGNIRSSDLLANTPYNTYVHTGLPPTPIAMPGLASLQAVAHPAPGSALFFVAIGDGSGRHLFANTYAEHRANVARYLRNYRQMQSARAQQAPAQATQSQSKPR